MLPPVWNVLRASPGVVDLVGLRIWRGGTAPQDEARKAVDQGLPYITWFVVTTAPENTLSERPKGDTHVIQIDCWAGGRDGEEQVETLAKAVRDAIEPHAYQTGAPVDGREPATRLWRMALQFDWITIRPLFVEGA